MHWNTKLISGLAIVLFCLPGIAYGVDSTNLSGKPASPASKIKAPASIAVPSPAPAPAVEPIKSVPDAAPKPVKKLPAPQQISPTPEPAKSPAVSSLPNVKPTGHAASLPQGVQQNNLPAIQAPADLGKTTRIPGSAGKDLSRTNNIGSKLPEGHTSPTSGFGSRSGAAGLTKGMGRRDGIGTVSEEFADQMGPVIRTGSGAQRQEQGHGEQQNQGKSEVDIDFSKDDSETKWQEEWKETNEAVKEDIYVDPVFITKEEKDVASRVTDQLLLGVDEGEEHAYPDERTDPKSERVADDGSGEGGSGGPVDPNRVKGIFAGSPGIRFAPGEEPTEGGTIDPSLLGTIQSSKTQVKTVDGIDMNSNNFEDLSKQIQDAIKAGGQGNPIVE